MEAVLKTLVAERKTFKSKLTILRKSIEAFNSKSDVLAFEKRIKANADLCERFDRVQAQIEALDLDEAAEKMQFEERESFENSYYNLMAIAERHVASVRGRQQVESTHSISGSPSPPDKKSAPRLPVISLPNFDGNLGRWIRFRDTFVSLVHNSDGLTDIDRCNYLLSTLRGPAARVIESLGISEVNYQLAWTRLKERYEDPKALVEHHINTLVEIPPAHKQDGIALGEFIDTAVNNVRALESLLSPTDLWNSLISFFLSKRLDSVSLDEWEKHTMSLHDRPNFHDFSKFIERRAQYLTQKTHGKSIVGNSMAPGHNKGNRVRGSTNNAYATASHLVSQQLKCLLCEGNHALQYCSNLVAMPYPERHETIKRLQVCFNCLLPGHIIKNCTRGNYRKCGKKHHTMLHRDEPSVASAIAGNIQETSDSVTVQSCVLNSAEVAIECAVLSTAIASVINSKGNKHKCRALLDVGSQTHFITEEFCKRIALPLTSVETMVGGIGQVANPIRSKAQLQIASSCNTFKAGLSCLVIKNITEKMPNVPLHRVNIPMPTGVTPADPEFQNPNRVDLLIGAGLFWQLLCVGQHKLEVGSLVWQKTRLGWVLGGSLNWPISKKKMAPTCHTTTNSQLHKSIAQFWEVEETPSSYSPLTSDLGNNECERHFKDTTTRNADGRYIVSIPFNNQLRELGESRGQAERRLLNMERRFRKNPVFHRKYVEFMREFEDLGHMSRITKNATLESEPSCYLPHHAVFKESSTTTKIRVVFDGSAKTSSGISLNDSQLIGPPVQNELINILIRFRKHRYVLSADIEKMYRQIHVRTEDRKFQRILWRPSEDAPIDTYELNTITYGTASASFLATRVLKTDR